MIRDFVNHGTHDPEEYPFLEELHALRRLLATLFALRNWAESRAQSTLHTWQMRDFLLITQVDAQNIEDCFEILQVVLPVGMGEDIWRIENTWGKSLVNLQQNSTQIN